MRISFLVRPRMMGRARRKSSGTSRDFAGLVQVAAVKIRFGPFTLDLDTRQLTRGKTRDSPRAQGVRAAWRRSSWIVRKSCPRRFCSNVSGLRPSSPRPTSRTSWPRFERPSATGPAPLDSSGPRTDSATRFAGTQPPCRAQRNRIDPRAGSSGAGGAFRCQKGSTWWDAIPTSRSGSTRRRSPAVTRGSW